MNSRKRLLSLICVALMTTEFLPAQAIANATTTLESKKDMEKENSSENTTHKEDSDSKEENKKEDKSDFITLEENKSEAEIKEEVKTETESKDKAENKDETNIEDKTASEFKNSIFTFFIREKENNDKEFSNDNKSKEFLSIKFNRETNKFEVVKNIEDNFSILDKNLSLEEKEKNSELLEIKVFDDKNKEKLNVKLLDNNINNKEELKKLLELEYKDTDSIQINILNTDLDLKIEDDIYGDVSKEKEDYSDGIKNLNYINNVRFQIKKDGIKTIYNEAPVINGLKDMTIIDESYDIMDGISITDDHDGEISLDKVETSVENIDENTSKVTYSVKDSWGRVTSGSRNIYVDDSYKTNIYRSAIETEVQPINSNSSSGSSSSSTLSDILIKVSGVTYGGGSGTEREERFKIKFDVPSQSIKVIDQDRRIMSNKITGDYFKFELYDKDMKLKKSVTLVGSDKSNSAKLKEINNAKYVIGDYIYIWHAESDTKLKIEGSITGDSDNTNYAEAIPQDKLINHRFEITNAGLKSVANKAPLIGEEIDTDYQVTKELSPITVKRGGAVDYWKDVKIKDDHDGFNEETIKNKKVSVSHTEVDTSILGNHTITYTITDSWGLSTTATREVTVSGTNPIENRFIEVYDNNNQLAFKIGFDSVNKTYKVYNIANIQLDNTSKNATFIFRVYSKEGYLKKTVNIKGTDLANSSLLSKIDGFSYEEGDYIELWAKDPKNNIKIIGGIEGTISESGNQNNGSNSSEGYNPDINHENGTDQSQGEDTSNRNKSTSTLEGSYDSTEEQPELPNPPSVETSPSDSNPPSNEENNKNDKIDLSNGIPEDYSNGIDNVDYMNNVRFQILENNIKAIYNEAPKFTFEDMTIKRGSKIENITQGVTITDDHDKQEELLSKVTVDSYDTSKVGTININYRVSDSWGRNTIAVRTVNVIDKEELEKNLIEIKNDDKGKNQN